jgi:hypothetical protein
MAQSAQLGQQGSDHGQYGQTPMATPYDMNGAANANQQQNENTQNVGDYSPMLPSGGLMQGQPKQWYPGMYPSTSPQFGTNPYAPQTFNVQGHPGHNPSTFAVVEPNVNNSAMSNQGQFVQRMASGGTGNFKYTEPPKQWNGPVSTNAPSYQNKPEDVMNVFGKGIGQQQPQAQPTGMGSAKGLGMASVLGAENPELAKSLGKGPAQPTVESPQEVVQPVQQANEIYAPKYAQYAPVRPNIDSYGNPLYNNGGSIKE